MSDSIVGICEIEFYLPGVTSLKEKRSVIKPLISKMRKQFNVAVAEVGHHDVWQSSRIGISTISNSSVHNRQMIQNVIRWIEDNFPDLYITKQDIEIL